MRKEITRFASIGFLRFIAKLNKLNIDSREAFVFE